MEDLDPDQRHAPHREPLQRVHTYSLFTPGDASAPKVCRDFVGSVLLARELAHLVAAATLCTSELVTNVHLHTKGEAMVRMLVRPWRVRVSVFDESSALPVPRQAGALECYGLGLGVVAATADLWGVVQDRGGRHAKGVWFELGASAGGEGVGDRG
ncbi:ATP-binding protein [Streptomyces sp. NBC_01465]|uniref:ATP-binding protein n=1 Tax=Streptomyces sp. NBC_01465 TaxID=2903878 RepID=UPI002E356C61|nr:ATP-binding protein [Streptomyces sp. NBC_01465]